MITCFNGGAARSDGTKRRFGNETTATFRTAPDAVDDRPRLSEDEAVVGEPRARRNGGLGGRAGRVSPLPHFSVPVDRGSDKGAAVPPGVRGGRLPSPPGRRRRTPAGRTGNGLAQLSPQSRCSRPAVGGSAGRAPAGNRAKGAGRGGADCSPSLRGSGDTDPER